MNRSDTVTGRALRDASLLLAESRPIWDISVAELCREAGITRDTFYRYAERPIDVLAAALDDRLSAMSSFTETLPAYSGTQTSVMSAPTRELLEHLRNHRAIYLNALHPHLDAALRDVIVARVEALLNRHLDEHPDIVPRCPQDMTTEERSMLVAYAASGAVGAMERWLTFGDVDDIDRPAEVIFAASAAWWLGRGAPPQ